MSKKDKLLQRLHKIPPPVDFTWEEFLSVMRGAGFTESCDGGSHYMFEHSRGFRFGASKTHPSGLLKRYQIKNAIDALATVSKVIEDEE